MLPTNSLKNNTSLEYSFLEITNKVDSYGSNLIRRAMDITLSMLVFLTLGWLFILVAIIIKTTSKGNAIYYHDRIGLNGTPFKMYKFRTMYNDAEKNGPALSFKNDPRVTPIGSLLRKLHIDELPQFYNVLKGDMTIIGARPERAFYIEQILQKTPQYKQILNSKPGLTSWGQLNFGYATSVDEMVERLNYDLFYLKNKSLKMDIKILLYTCALVFMGKNNI